MNEAGSSASVRRLVFLTTMLSAVGLALVACRGKAPDVPPPSASAGRTAPSARVAAFPGSCTTGWPQQLAQAFTAAATDQVGPSAGSGLDSLTCTFTRTYRDLPTTGQLSVDLWRLDPTAGTLSAPSPAEALTHQADENLRAVCLSTTTGPADVPGTRTAQKCVRNYGDGTTVGLSVTTDIAAVTVQAEGNYQNLNHDQVDAFLNKLASDTLSQALEKLQGPG